MEIFLVQIFTVHDTVNIDKAKIVGQIILDSVVGKTITDISFQRKNQDVTGVKSSYHS